MSGVPLVSVPLVLLLTLASGMTTELVPTSPGEYTSFCFLAIYAYIFYTEQVVTISLVLLLFLASSMATELV